ncbi:hypothetical protein FN976_24380 [Caenimonas sedimenti]|uniref:Uncharacterized protein n=1 Tax=Caenimonas sedimenti TaxID=2596921 RepID=A0A562ZI67_9BURK|nr:hypothetical protein [Caenimonas sedimenti]TWO68077.1 hypothetical protein FN976_24380 [Caenimonas sedimenti]
MDEADLVLLEVHDRMTGITSQPIAWLLVSRSEEVERRHVDGRIREASITLRFERLGYVTPGVSKSGWFEGGLDTTDAESDVSLTSRSLRTNGGVFLDLRGLEGHRIGTYLMNQIVLWAKQWPEAQVARITLQESDARHEDNRRRRNRFYEQFNIGFDYGADTAMRAGHSLPMLAKDLEPVTTWQDNIVVHQVAAWASESLDKQAHLQGELEHARRVIKERNGQILAAEKQPVRWALTRLWRQVAWRLS